MMKNNIYLRALKKQAVPYTPIWMMRQAGRYLPEYREIRKKAGSFLALCREPELACTVTMQPLARFPLDAAILFSDILVLPDAMGLDLCFVENEGPRFNTPLTRIAQIDNLPLAACLERVEYVFETIRLLRKEKLKVPLIGFSGSPWTLACYMLEGKGSRDFRTAKKWLYNAPEAFQRLLNYLTDLIAAYLLSQIEAGVEAIQIFDTWGGLLTTEAYLAFSLKPMQKIVKILKAKAPDLPITLFTKQSGQWLSQMAETGCDALSIDWSVDLAYARECVQGKVALQGNLDPMILLSNPKAIESAVATCLAAYGTAPGHVFNLGHGIDKETPVEHVEILIDAVHRLSKR